jgi:beta-lysine N6-acetyltransferase
MNATTEGRIMRDKIEKIGNSIIQHGKSNDRIYLLKLDPEDTEHMAGQLDQLAHREGYTKVFTKIPADAFPGFLRNGYEAEAFIPSFYKGKKDCVLASKFLSDSRRTSPVDQLDVFLQLMRKDRNNRELTLPSGFELTKLDLKDAVSVTAVFKEVFETYPFPVHDPEYIKSTMTGNSAQYFGVWNKGELVGVSTAETDFEQENAEMTDFAVLPVYRGKKLALHLLAFMEEEMKKAGIRTAYTIARLAEPGMNKTFLNAGYNYSGTLINNTNIAGNIESMNIFYKPL